ncbi:hypothetical protein FIU86_14895 [Roseovarius sp. THAF9]|uniref:hypothetical protein n=1 Tax=Roseovarius sp. THAF9 TaxID=2587847 RepID=UPI001269624E|nr:hypothetical protein [Roseovarius sp. THAF9]QFT94136.1 hypothetical protein FIU86_14895 [Roseovarius sp. THAF9]
MGCFALSFAVLLAFAMGGGWIGNMWVLMLVGVVIGPAAAMIMTLPVEATRPSVRASGMGVYWAFYYGLMGLAPTALGGVRAATDMAGSPLILAALIMALCAVLWGVFRRLQRQFAAAGPA